VPNAQVTAGSIINYTINGTRRVDLIIGVSYEDDVRKLKEPVPTVAVSELAESSANFVVRPWVKAGDYWDVYFDITTKVKLALDDHGISIPYPQHDIHIKSGSVEKSISV